MARKKRQVILPPTHVGAQPPRIASSAPGGSVANHVGPILEGFKISAAGAMKIADDAARVVYLKSLSKLAGLLEQEVSAVRKGLGSAQRSDIESFQKDIAARTVLLNRKTIDLGKQQKLANSYYGSSPFGKSAGYYAAATFQNIATGRIKVSNTQEALNAAYRAAYTVQLREAEIKMLHAQIAALQQASTLRKSNLELKQRPRPGHGRRRKLRPGHGRKLKPWPESKSGHWRRPRRKRSEVCQPPGQPTRTTLNSRRSLRRVL